MALGGGEEHAGGDFDSDLSCIPSLFGRLVYLSGLRDRISGRYEHSGLARTCGAGRAEQILQEAHEATFSRWLCRTLSEQYEDLTLYLSGVDIDCIPLMRHWARYTPYRDLLPAGVKEPERELYFADMKAIVEAITGEPDPWRASASGMTLALEGARSGAR